MSVVTPSYNMLGYLRRCHASIADQVGPTHEHIVVDAESTDGTPEWLRSMPTIRSIVEKDRGMYDAVNKGFRIARGQIVSFLNCDEQYLPGTLAFVKDYFEAHPSVDVLFGDTILIRPDGSLLGVRKTYVPSWLLILGTENLYLMTCAMFIRRRVIDAGHLFDPGYKGAGDHEFISRLQRQGYQLRNVRHFLAAFTLTGSNHSQTAYEDLRQDALRVQAVTPAWLPPLKLPLTVLRVMLKVASGAHTHRSPVVYEVYPSSAASQRRTFRVERASTRWPTQSQIVGSSAAR
jgi:glycosyltransferase involved in cell wall biosynthesis